MKPYYDDGAVKIFLGDCREIVPSLGKFDLLLTDPPYGIGESSQKVKSRQRTKSPLCHSLANQKDYGDFDWDNEPPSPETIALCRSVSTHQIIWGGNYFNLPPARCWLFWDKLNGDNDFADGEMAWTNLDKAVRRKCHLWNGMLRKGQEIRLHPTQKPLEIITWALSLAGDVQTIIDPFAGSGTTGRAAKDLGRKCTLIEREEKYCEIAAKRMQQEVLQFA